VVARPKKDIPTDREIEILQVLWRTGPSSTRDITDALNSDRRKKIAYNSVHTILTIMVEKGLIFRDESNKSHVYAAVVTQEATEARLIRHMTQKVFGGSTMHLVIRALSSQGASPQDVAEIQKLLTGLESEDEST
jgi:BlaI family penicillinase repressor